MEPGTKGMRTMKARKAKLLVFNLMAERIQQKSNQTSSQKSSQNLLRIWRTPQKFYQNCLQNPHPKQSQAYNPAIWLSVCLNIFSQTCLCLCLKAV